MRRTRQRIHVHMQHVYAGPPFGIPPEDMMVVNTVHASTFVSTRSARMRGNAGMNSYFHMGSQFMKHEIAGAYAAQQMMIRKTETEGQFHPENAAYQYQNGGMMQHLYDSVDGGRERSTRMTNSSHFESHGSHEIQARKNLLVPFINYLFRFLIL